MARTPACRSAQARAPMHGGGGGRGGGGGFWLAPPPPHVPHPDPPATPFSALSADPGLGPVTALQDGPHTGVPVSTGAGTIAWRGGEYRGEASTAPAARNAIS